MDRNNLNNIVAANVAAAIKLAGLSEASIARDTGIPLTTLRRKLERLNGASFTVGELALIGVQMNVDPAEFFAETVAA